MAKVASRLFAAQVVHTRYKPVKNSFNYPVYYYAFDLDELQNLSDRVRCVCAISAHRISIALKYSSIG
jgi:DUF1365 family protein